jgi:hypothetical protein
MEQIQIDKKKGLLFNVVKMSGMVYIGILYSTFLIIGSIFIDKLFNKYGTHIDKLEETPLWKIILEVLLEMTLIIIWIAFTRKLVNKIPFIFEDIEGFHIKKLREVNGTVIGVATLLLLLNDYKTKILFIVNAFKQKLNI